MSVLKPGTNCMGIYHSDGSGLIVDACEYYRSFHRAALQARRHILLAGWQFDSEVCLLRGKDAGADAGEVRFLHFLEHLCETRHELEIYLLAWDFSLVFSLEREWFQDILFNWTTNDRIHFRFDNRHALGATHHQKFIVIDGSIAFVGGMDICCDRWDDRSHRPENPYRVDANGPYGSYHDIQSYHTGPVVEELTALFETRWADSGAPPLALPPVEARHVPDMPGLLPLQGPVAISRTQAPCVQPSHREILEIRKLFIDAILSADALIYMENQYFSSQAVYWALVHRMEDETRPRLQIVLILPDRLPFTEELVLGLPQMKMLRALERVARATGHGLGVYSTICTNGGERKMTFIHSKLLLVDDRFLTIGSANLTNRSMGLDTELNVSWEASDSNDGLVGRIRGIRLSLLAEHAGIPETEAEGQFGNGNGLIELLDRLAEDGSTRLCRYSPDPVLENSIWQDALEPVSRVVDPEETFFELITRYSLEGFARGIRLLINWIT